MTNSNQKRLGFSALLITAALFFGASSLHAQDSEPYKGEIRLAFKEPINKPVEIGSTLNLPISVAYADLPKKSRVYAHLLALADDKWITVGGATLGGSDMNFSFSGGFREAKQTLFQYGAGNFPIERVIKKTEIAKILEGFGVGKGQTNKFADAIATNAQGYQLTLAFLAAVGDKTTGFRDATLSIKIPDYPHYYDGILIVPFIFHYDETGVPTVYFSGKKMNALRVPVLPNRPKPKPKKTTQVRADQLPGEATVQRYSPSNAIITTGAANSLKLEVAYKNLAPGSAIYVAVIPTHKGRYIFGKYALTLPGIRGAVKPKFFDDTSPRYGIPIENKAIEVPFAGGQVLEAALVATVQSGGTGVIEGIVTFVPPPYATRYERVHIMPLLLIPTPSGIRVLMDTDRMKGPKILVSEG